MYQDKYTGGASTGPQLLNPFPEFLVPERNISMSRNTLVVLVVVLAVCAVGAGYLYYQERQSGIDIEINEQGVTIDGN